MVGGLDWSQRQFNSAIKAQVQPGSTAGFRLSSQRASRQEARKSHRRPAGDDGLARGAVGYRGETTLKEAIASSRNAAAVRLAKELGVPAVGRSAGAWGSIQDPVPTCPSC